VRGLSRAADIRLSVEDLAEIEVLASQQVA
jgi:hypothetical protein